MKEIRFSFDEDNNDSIDTKDIDREIESIFGNIKNNSLDEVFQEKSEIEINDFKQNGIYNKYNEQSDNENTDDLDYYDDDYDQIDDAEEEFDSDEENIEDEIECHEKKERIRRTKSKVNNTKRKRFFYMKKVKALMLTIIITAGTVVVLLASPLFAVKNIEINDMHYFTKEEICSRIGLNIDDNGVFFNCNKAEKKLKEDKNISLAEITFKMPDTMIINISENRVYGYIPYLGSYLYIDRDGRVLEIKNEIAEKLPVIDGLQFDSFTQGEIIPVQNTDAFETALIISKAMMKYEMLDKTIKINVSDSKAIYAYVDNVKVLLGDTSRMEEKIKTMSEAVKEIPEGDRGTLNLEDLDKPIIFKYTT